IVPSIRVGFFGRWTEFIRHHQQLGVWVTLHLIKAIRPITRSKSNGVSKKSRLVEGDAHFQPQPARRPSLRKKQIAAAGATANSQILCSGAERVESIGDRFGSNGLFVWRKTRILPVRRGNHMSAKNKDLPWRPSHLRACRSRQCPVYNLQTGLNFNGPKTKVLV